MARRRRTRFEKRMKFESDITPTAADRHHPMLKLALELGPLLVFFFANLRGEWLAANFPVLADARRAALRRERLCSWRRR